MKSRTGNLLFFGRAHSWGDGSLKGRGTENCKALEEDRLAKMNVRLGHQRMGYRMKKIGPISHHASGKKRGNEGANQSRGL